MLYFTISALRAKRVSISIYVSHIHWSHRHIRPIFYNQSTRITLSPMSFLQATDHTPLSPFLSPSLPSHPLLYLVPHHNNWKEITDIDKHPLFSFLRFRHNPTQLTNPSHLISSHLTSSHFTPPHSRLLTHDIHIIKPRAARAVARRSITLFP